MATGADLATVGAHSATDRPSHVTLTPCLGLCRLWPSVLWSELPNLSFCIPAGLAHRYVVIPVDSLHCPFLTIGAEVPVPTDFGLPYQDLPLVTPDNVTLRCYLMTQRKNIPFRGAMPVETTDSETDEEVCALSLLRQLFPLADAHHTSMLYAAFCVVLRQRMT